MRNFLENFNFSNKNIFVIGGSGLIGSSVIKNFENLKGKVFNLDIKKSKNNNAKFIKFDCTKLNGIENLLTDIFKNHGYPDIVINCSYPYDKNWSKCSSKNIKIDYLKKNTEYHLLSYTWISKIVAEKMKSKKIKGKIINMTSIYGFLGQDLQLYKNTNLKDNLAYSIIKGGIINLTRQLSSIYGKFGITVNCLSSGGVEGKVAGTKKKQSKIFKINYSKKTPLGRLAKPEEISSVIVFLSSGASNYISGANIIVDGGWSII